MSEATKRVFEALRRLALEKNIPIVIARQPRPFPYSRRQPEPVDHTRPIFVDYIDLLRPDTKP